MALALLTAAVVMFAVGCWRNDAMMVAVGAFLAAMAAIAKLREMES
jgi:uncharacterized membrane protein YiaA